MSILYFLRDCSILALGSTVPLAIIIWLAKAIAKHEIAKDFEVFKSDVQKRLTEHEIQFSALHAERAQTIKHLYALLYTFQMAMKAFFSIFDPASDPEKIQRRDSAAKAFTDINLYFETNRILFQPHVCKLFDDLLGASSELWIQFEGAKVYVTQNGSPQDQIDKTKKWNDISTALPIILLPIKQQLEDEFRRLLGVC